MNEHILMAMKWLNDKNSVTKQELTNNRDAAYVADDADAAAYYATCAAATATVDAVEAANAADAAVAYAADAANVAYYTTWVAVADDVGAAERWLKRYYELGEHPYEQAHTNGS
jgi:flagellar biosynthesis regulator FlaF